MTERGKCLDLKWNAGEDMLLAHFAGGDLLLFNTSEGREVNQFER